MSLPPTFATPEEYFQESTRFFRKYQHLFKTANTDILLNNTLDEIAIENLENGDIFEKDFKFESVREKNEFLSNFFEELSKLKVTYESIEEDDGIESVVNAPISVKKKHEIIHLAREIKEICAKSKCETVVDFGAGLGYLDQLIYETANVKVLGVECNENHYVGAKKRQNKYHAESCHYVKYFRHTISENSDQNIEKYLLDKFGKSNFCITGLHACADLTIDGVSLFLKLADAKAMILVPCCYHKMAVSDETKFRNFPLSNCLKKIYENERLNEFMGVPFLRLGAQPPNSDENVEDLVFNLLARATLQLYAQKHACKLKRNKRKAVRTKTIEKDFSQYLQSALVGFTLTPENNSSASNDKDGITTAQFNVEELHDIWREIQSLKTKTAIFKLLQRHLQPVIENFILYDRIVYLNENGLKNVSYKKIFDEKISPRCLALICFK